MQIPDGCRGEQEGALNAEISVANVEVVEFAGGWGFGLVYLGDVGVHFAVNVFDEPLHFGVGAFDDQFNTAVGEVLNVPVDIVLHR